MSVDAVGLDSDRKQKTAGAEAAAKKEMLERRESRAREKDDWHKQKEMERENIRTKYQIPKKNAHRYRKQNNRSSSDKKCTIS